MNTFEEKLAAYLAKKHKEEAAADAKRLLRARKKKRTFMRHYMRRYRKANKAQAFQKRKVELVMLRHAIATRKEIAERIKELQRKRRLNTAHGWSAGFLATQDLSKEDAMLYRKCYLTGFTKGRADKVYYETQLAKVKPTAAA